MKQYAVFLCILLSGFLLATHFLDNQNPADAHSAPVLVAPPAPIAQATAPELPKETTVPPKATTAPQNDPISAKSFITVLVYAEGNTTILAQKNSQARLPIASLTKLMTAIVATNNYNPGEVAVIPQEAADTKGSSGKLKPGQKFFTSDLLYPLLIESDNDAGIALASKMEPGKFVELMNQEAVRLGLLNTQYTNPTGLDPDDVSEPNHSTAEDIARLVLVIAKNYPDILRILSLRTFDLKIASGAAHHTLVTTNKLFEEQLPFRILGGKTGETPLAKKNLVLLTAGPGENSIIITVVLGSEDNFKDAKKLLIFSASE